MQKGQALLLVLLSMAVILTIVLSILSTSITDIAVSTKEEEALRAFSAAEAGIEQALVIGSDIGTTALGDAQFSANVSSVAEGASYFTYPTEIVSGDLATIWLVAHDDDGSLTCSAAKPCFTGSQMKICWGKPGTPGAAATTPAIEVSVYYATTPGDYSTVKVARAAIDPGVANRVPANGFSAASGNCSLPDGASYAFSTTVNFATLGASSFNLQNGLQMVRVRMLYNTSTPQTLGIDVALPGNSTLPSQGARIESTGEAGEATRKVEVFRLFSEVPPIFESSLFSPIGVTK